MLRPVTLPSARAGMEECDCASRRPSHAVTVKLRGRAEAPPSAAGAQCLPAPAARNHPPFTAPPTVVGAHEKLFGTFPQCIDLLCREEPPRANRASAAPAHSERIESARFLRF